MRELQNSIWGQMPYGRTTLPVAGKGLRSKHLARPAYHRAPFGIGFGFLANRL